MDTYDPRRKPKNSRPNSARERHLAREQRRRESTGMAVLRGSTERSSEREEEQQSGTLKLIVQHLGLWLRDGLWYITHRPSFLRYGMIVAVVLFMLFTASHIFGGRIFPNVWVMGLHVGSMTVEEAQLAIAQAWTGDVRIRLMVEGEQELEVTPSQMGLQVDAASAAAAARNVGMSGIPFGYSITPTFAIDYQTAQNYLLRMTETINTLPYNAGYELTGSQVVGVAGRDGRELDIAATLDYLQNYTDQVISSRRLDLLMLSIPPDVTDPQPFIEDVQQLIDQEFAIVGYDPFTDKSTAWSTTPQEFVSWLEAGNSRITVRRGALIQFVQALNEQLLTQDNTLYINPEEAVEQVDQAVAEQDGTIYLRLSHKPTEYEIGSGDFAYRVARRTGIPYFLIADMNPGRDLNQLSVGDVINLPSVDVTLPEIPVATKRIVVDLDNQELVAFENGKEVFRWQISSGIERYPTSPGIYQILSHEEIAYGSSYALCADDGGSCGEWKMYWFMGIYEVQQGLMNGFHGAVELPDGTYLGGGSVGQPYTYGCIMSENEKAEMLYNWAELGTMVEIVSSEYEPKSDLARQVYQQS